MPLESLFLWAALIGLMLPWAHTLCPNEIMYPYGPEHGDDELGEVDDGPPGEVTLDVPFIFYGTPYTELFMNPNGPISFETRYTQPLPRETPVDDPPFLAAFWNDMSFASSLRLPLPGRGYFRKESDPAIRARADYDVFKAIGDTINSAQVYIATWVDVSMLRAPPVGALENTFQVVLVTDGTRSYSLFHYKTMTWSLFRTWEAVASFNKGRSSGVVVTVGFSGTARMLEMAETTNCGTIGRYAARTDPDVIDVREPNCICKVDSTGDLLTFDGEPLSIVANQKTVMTQNSDMQDDCKFRVTTFRNANGRRWGEAQDPIWWASFSFGRHPHNTGFYKTVYFDWTTKGSVIMNGYQARTTPDTPFTWTTPDGSTSVSVSGDRTSGWTLCSSTCAYWMDYHKECDDPDLLIYIDKKYAYLDGLEGICQNCNDDRGDDRTPCDLPSGESSHSSKSKSSSSGSSSSKSSKSGSSKSKGSKSGSSKSKSSSSKSSSSSGSSAEPTLMEIISQSCRAPLDDDSSSSSKSSSSKSSSSKSSRRSKKGRRRSSRRQSRR